MDSGARCPGGGSAAAPARAPGLRVVLLPALGPLRSCHPSSSSCFTAHCSPHSGGPGGSRRRGRYSCASLTTRRVPGVASLFLEVFRALWRLSSWAPAHLSPSQFAAGSRHAAHSTWESGGGCATGDAPIWAPWPPGGPQGTPPPRRPGPGHRAPTRGPAFFPRLSFPSRWIPRGTPLKAPRRTSARAPARPTPLQPAAGTPHAAHPSRGSGGAPPQGDPLKRLLRRSGGSRRIPSSRRLGRRGSGSAPPGMRATQHGASGASLVGQGCAASPVRGGPRPEVQRRLYFVPYGAQGPRHPHQGADRSASASSRRSSSDGHFGIRAAAHERGLISPPLTSTGPQWDGETAGTAGAAPPNRQIVVLRLEKCTTAVQQTSPISMGQQVYIRNFVRRWRDSKFKGPYLVIQSTPTAVKVEGRKPWIHLSDVRLAPASCHALPSSQELLEEGKEKDEGQRPFKDASGVTIRYC
ncbi:hypothetical protein NDU88_006839 [Pleurodeles waltl]|uniref:Murine leukemia virus integrase C-terminal domain-containing protein n=1 Tax=Pleurodeles waltl TaxID=8319 RepID=A0AAV7RT60_PLEWA|nr:hypothetical protein NDU88_006839 [Pleurodeles waltl]